MPSATSPSLCVLCSSAGVGGYHTGSRGVFHRCGACDLVFLDPTRWPTMAEEIERYAQHDNRSDHEGYRQFLRRLAEPIVALTPVGSTGLDYGCGPAPVLAELLTSSGRPTAGYDPAFRPDETALTQRHDFIACSEVVEHVHDPSRLFDEFARLVRPGGIVGIMTGLRDGVPSFADWWYIRDTTHVCFYSRATMRWVAAARGWDVSFPTDNVTIFQL